VVRKGLDFQHLRTRATVYWGNTAKQSGGGMISRTIKGVDDWSRVGDMAEEAVKGGKKDVRDELKVQYCEIQEEDKGEDSKEEGELGEVEEIESIPVSTKYGSSLGKKRALGWGMRGPKIGEEKIGPGGKRRKTTTIAHEEDMEKKKSMEVSWIPEHQQKKQPAPCCVLPSLCAGRCGRI